MIVAIVTVKLPRNPHHNPRDKQTNVCPANQKFYDTPFHTVLYFGTVCTDWTGEHHSFIAVGKDLSDIENRAKKQFGHVTRIETVRLSAIIGLVEMYVAGLLEEKDDSANGRDFKKPSKNQDTGGD